MQVDGRNIKGDVREPVSIYRFVSIRLVRRGFSFFKFQ